MPKKKVVTAEYNHFGYEVFVDGAPVYQAGNAVGDSTVAVPAERGVGLQKLRQYAVQTAKEIAKERGARFGGVERTADEDPYAQEPEHENVPRMQDAPRLHGARGGRGKDLYAATP